MIRHGMFTIGVAVQAETFTNTPTQRNNNNIIASTSTTSNSFPSTTSSSAASKSAIFLAPFKSGNPQSLRITFAYNKDTNLPEVIINLNEGDEEQYLKLKEKGSIFREKNISSDNSIDISKALQLYGFEKMDSLPSTTQVLELEPLTLTTKDNSLSPQTVGSSDTKNNGVKKAHSNLEKTLITPNSLVTKNEIQEENGNSENIKLVEHHIQGSKKKSDLKKEEQNNNHKNEKANVCEKKILSPKSKTKEESTTTTNTTSKSSSKSNGRLMRKKSKSRVIIIENGESIIPPESPTKGNGDKSKIPFINSAATGFMPCEYYRQKWLQENGCTDPDSWNDFTTIQKTAGQKVINKMTAQQKKLEEDAVAQRKRTEFVFHEDLGSLDVSQSIIPIRKKQTRLEPLRTIPKCH